MLYDARHHHVFIESMKMERELRSTKEASLFRLPLKADHSGALAFEHR